MSSTVSIATPTRPDLTEGAGRIGVDPHLRGEIEGHGDPRLAGLEQQAEAGVGLGGGAEAGVLAHGPEAAAIHVGLDAAGERKDAGVTEVARVVERGDGGADDGGDGETGGSGGGEARHRGRDRGKRRDRRGARKYCADKKPR